MSRLGRGCLALALSCGGTTQNDGAGLGSGDGAGPGDGDDSGVGEDSGGAGDSGGEGVVDGLGAITGPGFAYVNAETGQVNFQALRPYRFGNFIDYLDGVAKAAAQSTTWVPAPVPVIGTVNVHIEQLHLDFGQQPPGESRGSSDGRVA